MQYLTIIHRVYAKVIHRDIFDIGFQPTSKQTVNTADVLLFIAHSTICCTQFGA